MLNVQRRVAIVGATTALLSSTLLATTGTGAAADPTECEPNDTWVKVRGTSLYALTHHKGYQLPPDSSLTITKGATHEATLSAGVKVTAGVSGSVGGILAKAEAHFGVELAASGSRTSTKNESVTATVGGDTEKDRYVVAWAGNRYYYGKWEHYTCNSRGSDSSLTGHGSWRSFRSSAEGIALCPYHRYPEGSWMYKACKKNWPDVD